MDINNNFFDEFEEQSQLELRDLNFLNLDEINYLQLKDDMYKDVSFNKKISFSEIMYESKYNATDKCKACEDKFYSGDINIKLLAEDIKKNNSNTSFFFFYQKYTKNLPIVDLFPVEDVSQQLNTKSSNNFLSKSSLKFPTSIPFEYVEENTKKKKTGQLQVFLNQRACNVNISKYGFSFAKDLVNNKIKYRLEFIYSDSIDKRQFVTKGNENSYVVEDKYVAISIETESCDDFIALVQYLNLTYLFYTAVSVFLSNQLLESKTVDELVFIYNQLPSNTNYLKQINIKSDVLKNHVDILLKHDTTGFLKFYNDESGTLIKIFSLIILNPLYIEILFDNVYIKNIYSNLSGKSTWNDTQLSNKILFAELLSAMALSNKLGDNKPIGKTFYYGNDYKIDSDISWFSSENEDEFYLQQYKEESYQVEVSTETDDFGVSTNALGQTETRTIKKKLDDGAMYKPLDLVTLIYYKGQDKQILLVPAIYIKALAEEDEWIEVDKNIRIGLDILAVIGGFVVLGTTGNPLFLAAAYADIAIAGTDVIVQLSTKELEKTPQGRDFLQTWEQIYLAGGIATAIISAPQLLQSFYSVGNKILKTAKGAVLVEVRQFYLKAFLEINISNFKGNTVTVLSNNTEIVIATNGLLNLEKEIKLFQNGILTVAGQVQNGEKIEEQIALIYKGEAIIQGNKNTFKEAARKLVNSTHNEKKLLELCDELWRRIPKIEGKFWVWENFVGTKMQKPFRIEKVLLSDITNAIERHQPGIKGNNKDKLFEAEVALEMFKLGKKRNDKAIDFASKINKGNIGEIDYSSTKYIIEAKTNLDNLDALKELQNQLKRYIVKNEVIEINYLNAQNKTVVVVNKIGQIDKTRKESLEIKKQLEKDGVIFVNGIENLKKLY
jgi:hypothetical protein